MSLSLYEINELIRNYEMEFDDDGVWTNEQELDDLKLSFKDKIENILLFVKSLRAEAKAIKEEEDNLKARRKALENKADRLEDYAALNLGGDKFETPRVKVRWTPSSPVEILNLDAVPERFIENKVVKTPIKVGENGIKKYLESLEAEGKTVPWARLVHKLNMSIK